MAVTIGDVTIRIGASTRTLNRDLRNAERALQQSAAKFQSIGQSMSLSLTAPLVGLGIAATQSFGEFERLSKSLEAVVGDAGLAAEQFERLKVIAEAPGLALPQVVSASAKLQAVGLSAAEAEKTIIEYGNAVARSGGTAESFDGAVLALTQIASKGKISAEELNQLGERIFEIRPALQAAFGTSNSEELQKLGISAQDFIARTTAELAKLQRVEGGLSNSFENFRDSVTGSLAALGESISKSINLPKILDRISGALSSAADAFKELSPQSQRFVVILGATIAAIGPLAYVVGILKSAYGSVIIEIVKMSAALIAKTTTTTAETAATRVATATTITFNTALRATLLTLAPYALALGAIVAVAYGISKAMGSASDETERYKISQKDVNSQLAEQTSETRSLIAVIKDENKTRDEKGAALKRLQQLAPAYFENLSIEKDSIDKITASYDKYIRSITNSIKANLQKQKLTDELVREQELLEKINDINQKIAKGDTRVASAGTGGGQVKSQVTILKEQRQVFIDQLNVVQDNITQNEKLIASYTDFNKEVEKTASTGGAGAISDLTKQLQALDLELVKITRLYNAGLIDSAEAASQRTDVLQKKLELLVVNGFDPASKSVLELRKQLRSFDTTTPLDVLPSISTDPLAGLRITVQKRIAEIRQDTLEGINKGLQGKVKFQGTSYDSWFKDFREQLDLIDIRQERGFIPSGEADAQKIEFLTTSLKALQDQGFSPLSPQILAIETQLKSLGINIEGNLLEKLTLAQQSASAFKDTFASSLNSAFELVGETIGKAFTGQSDIASFFNGILSIVAEFAKSFGKQLIAIGTANLALQNLFKAGPAGATAAILAGIGLVAVASAVQANLAKNLPSLAIGTDKVKSDGLAMIHKGEAIVPANVVGGGFTGGGNQIYGRLSGIDLLLSNQYAAGYQKRLR